MKPFSLSDRDDVTAVIQEGVFRGVVKAAAVYAAIAFLVWMIATLAGCSSSTGPKVIGVDPTVLITNQMPADTVFFTWRDGQGVVGADTVLAGRQVCAKFTARPDSAYFQVVAHYHANDGNMYVTTTTAPWFNPSVTDGWTIEVRLIGASADVVSKNTSPILPC